MMQGKGRNNPDDYEAGIPNPPGGICNGITSGVEDEQDIAFLPPTYGTRADWSWRWKEQWIPHSAWLILALAAEATADLRGSPEVREEGAAAVPASYEGREANAPWRMAAAARIDRLRKADLAIQVLNADGNPAAGATVEIRMTRQAYVIW